MTKTPTPPSKMAPRPADLQITRTHNLGLRSNLRAGLAWDGLDDTAKDWWGKLSNSVAKFANAVTGGSNNTSA